MDDVVSETDTVSSTSSGLNTTGSSRKIDTAVSHIDRSLSHLSTDFGSFVMLAVCIAGFVIGWRKVILGLLLVQAVGLLSGTSFSSFIVAP